MKRIISLLLALLLVFSLSPAALGAGGEEAAAAEALHSLGLFNGTGTGADGAPIYELDRAPTRNEAVTMLVRLLGKEEEALAGTWQTPFTDLADWAAPYVGYAYANGLTLGVSDDAFGGGGLVTASQYLTFVLRAMDYVSGTDFQWDTAWTLSDELGITRGEYGRDDGRIFLRGDAARVSFFALGAPRKGDAGTLAQRLILEGVFPAAAYDGACTAFSARREEQDLSPEAVYAGLIAMKAEYPEGTPWTNLNEYVRYDMFGYSSYTGCGCVGFAMILSDAVFGDLPYREIQAGGFSYDSIRVGDILRINRDTHSVVVLEKREDVCVIAEGNFNSSIHWGRVISRSTAESADFLWTRYPE